MDQMDYSECDVFRATISWADEVCKNKDLPASPQNLRAELEDCLTLIRFPTMTVQEYVSCMENYPDLLDYNVLLDIWQYIISKKERWLPPINLAPIHDRLNLDAPVLCEPGNKYEFEFEMGCFATWQFDFRSTDLQTINDIKINLNDNHFIKQMGFKRRPWENQFVVPSLSIMNKI